jgi:hypothetical protein
MSVKKKLAERLKGYIKMVRNQEKVSKEEEIDKQVLDKIYYTEGNSLNF